VSWWLLISAALATDPATIETSVQAEIDRAMEEIRLPDQAGPYLVEVDLLDGEVTTSWASFGATTYHESQPYRNSRVEVRVGDLKTDSSNFVGLYGVQDGVESRQLAIDDVPISLRQEIWLAMDDAYKGASQQLAGKIAARDGQERTYTPDSTSLTPLTQSWRPFRPVDEDQVRTITQALSSSLANIPELEKGKSVGRDWQGMRLLMTSTGSRAWMRTGHTIFRVDAVARTESGALVRNTRSWVARTPDQLPALEEMQKEVHVMASWIVQARSAPVEEDYLGPVLFESQAATELFRQLLHPQVIGTPPMEDAPDANGSDGISPPVARIGRRIMPSGWTVVDDPSASAALAGSYTHDYEGTAAQRVALIEDGIVRNLLMSRIPRKDLSGSTGHGRSLGVSRRSGMPGVITVTPPRVLSDKALRRKALQLARQANLPYIIVVRRIATPAMDHTFEMAFQGDGPLAGLTTPTEAYRLYLDGHEEPVRNVAFVGVDRRVMRDIVAAGRSSGPIDMMDRSANTSRFSLGPVDGLPVTWTAPPVVISEIEIRGKPGGEQRIIPPPPRNSPPAEIDPGQL